MVQNGRAIDANFRSWHALFYRCEKEDLAGERLLPTRIKCENTSVNWSKYSKPWDVIFDYPKHGIAQFCVGILPSELPKEKPSGGKAKPHSFRPHHVPLTDNYSHSEITTYRDNLHVPKPNLPATVKKEFRTIMSDCAVIVLDPEI